MKLHQWDAVKTTDMASGSGGCGIASRGKPLRPAATSHPTGT